jgi:heptosyltransferase II
MDLIKYFRFIDKYIGSALVFLLQIFVSQKKIKDKKQKKNIAVIRLWTLGESLLTLPMIKKLKEEKCIVTIFVTKRSKWVFEHSSYVDKVILIQNPFMLLGAFRKYDVAIDTEPYLTISSLIAWFVGKRTIGFKGLYREKLYSFPIRYNDRKHSVLNFCDLLKPLDILCKPTELVAIHYDINSKTIIEKLLEKLSLKDKKLAGIHAGTAETAIWRSWSKDKFAKLIDKLILQGYTVLLTGAPHESKKNQEIIELTETENKDKIIDFAGRTNLSELSYLMKKFDVFVSNDTGPMHLSAAMGTHTVGLFGPNLPERFRPFGKGNFAVYKARDMPCSPCINVHKGEFGKCEDNGACMDKITVEDVMDAVKKVTKNENTSA